MSSIIWTKHAIERNKERQITQSWVEATVNSPDNYSKIEGGKIKSNKTFGKYTVSVITTKSDTGQYLILSSWINPPMNGTSDHKSESFKKEFKKANLLKKFWITLIRQIGF